MHAGAGAGRGLQARPVYRLARGERHGISCIGGHVFQGMWGVGYRLGVAYRNILGIEWVLPNGEILRTGSFSQDADNGFWGEGPGPDLRGMLRGYAGAMGGVGMVTKMAVKLHPYPGPKVWPVEGMIPNQTSVLPEDRFKWYMVKYEYAGGRHQFHV